MIEFSLKHCKTLVKIFNQGIHETLGRFLLPVFRFSSFNNNLLLAARSASEAENQDVDSSTNETESPFSVTPPAGRSPEMADAQMKEAELGAQLEEGPSDRQIDKTPISEPLLYPSRDEELVHTKPQSILSSIQTMPFHPRFDLIDDSNSSFPSLPSSRSQSTNDLFEQASTPIPNGQGRSPTSPPSPRYNAVQTHAESPVVEVLSPSKKRKTLIERAKQKFKKF